MYGFDDKALILIPSPLCTENWTQNNWYYYTTAILNLCTVLREEYHMYADFFSGQPNLRNVPAHDNSRIVRSLLKSDELFLVSKGIGLLQSEIEYPRAEREVLRTIPQQRGLSDEERYVNINSREKALEEEIMYNEYKVVFDAQMERHLYIKFKLDNSTQILYFNINRNHMIDEAHMGEGVFSPVLMLNNDKLGLDLLKWTT